MTVDGMNHIPENSNYGPPNGYVPPTYMNGSSWRDSSSHPFNNGWVQPQQMPSLANSWKPPDNHSLPPMSMPPPPVTEYVILDQDPHKMGLQLPPPPPPPFIPSVFAAAAPSQHNSYADFYFFNPPTNNQHLHYPPPSVSESSQTTSSPPINQNEEVDMSISSGASERTTPRNFNDELPFESQSVEYVVENQEQEVYGVYEGESVAAQIINCPEPYIPPEMSSVRQKSERRRSRSRSPRRTRSPSPDRSRSTKRRESSRRKKDSERNDERRSSRGRSPSVRRRRSPSVSRSRRHDENDRHVSSKSSSDRRKSSTRRHSHSRRSVSPKRSSHRTSSSRRRGESVDREKQKRVKAVEDAPNVVDQQLQAFAQEAGDPDAMLKKLKQKMMEKLKKTVMETQPEDTVSTSENDSVDTNTRSIRLYYDTEPMGEKDTNQNGEGSEYVIASSGRDSDGSYTTVETEIYPWYRNAPIQRLIGKKFLQLKGKECTCRPQIEDDKNVCRTFPKRKKVYRPDNILSPNKDSQPPLNKNANIVKEAGSGFIVRRNGAMSWVSKTLMSTADAANMNNAAAAQSPNSHFSNKNSQIVNGQRIPPDSNECFEYLKTKICQAGALCKYNHNGHNEHQKIKFCQRYMNGLCRDGDNCSKGSHALLPHQIPVCGYYLRASCPYLKGCPFLHVKNSAKTPLCIHFNKGKCLAEFPCVFTHRYCPTIINARTGHGEERAMNEKEESTKTILDDIQRLQWIE